MAVTVAVNSSAELVGESPRRRRLVILVAAETPASFANAVLAHGEDDASATNGAPLGSARSVLEISGALAAKRWTVFAVGANIIAGVIEHYD